MNTATLTRDSASALPFLGVAGLLWAGSDGVIAVAAGGVVSWLGLLATGWAMSRLLADADQAPSLAVAVIVGKTATVLSALAWLMTQFDPTMVGLGACCVVVGALVGGLREVAAHRGLEAEEG
jgi:Na+-translocating ferredoxin:NAD+ oxidoreductase RnfE subunit